MSEAKYMPGQEYLCRVCKREYKPSHIYICCSGRDCGCGGETVAFEVCSAACAEKEQEECDHEWEYESADPSVGIMSGSRTCVKCEESEPYDRSEDFDDNYF